MLQITHRPHHDWQHLIVKRGESALTGNGNIKDIPVDDIEDLSPPLVLLAFLLGQIVRVHRFGIARDEDLSKDLEVSSSSI